MALHLPLAPDARLKSTEERLSGPFDNCTRVCCKLWSWIGCSFRQQRLAAEYYICCTPRPSCLAFSTHISALPGWFCEPPDEDERVAGCNNRRRGESGQSVSRSLIQRRKRRQAYRGWQVLSLFAKRVCGLVSTASVRAVYLCATPAWSCHIRNTAVV